MHKTLATEHQTMMATSVDNQQGALMVTKSDSLRSVLSYYESNIASSQNSASKSFLANIVSSPGKRTRRLSMSGLAEEKPPNDKPQIPTGPKRMSRRASWCSGVDASYMRSLTRSPREETATISKGTVGKTKAMFEGMSQTNHTTTTSKSRISRRSSVGPGVQVPNRRESSANKVHFQQMLDFWASLPKPNLEQVPPPRFPRRWNSLYQVPETVRDIALKAATPICLCADDDEEEDLGEADSTAHKTQRSSCSSSNSNHSECNSVCSSCGLDTVLDTDDSSVVSSAMCVFDGSNLYLPLPQGCMVFRSNPGGGGSVGEAVDHQPQRPFRHGSMHRAPSVRSLNSFASFSVTTPPRRVRIAEENNEVWFFEVDDLCSVFSEDGLELDQDFASIFDSGNDQGPRQVRRHSSSGSVGSNASSWEYVGFYDEVKLPQDFGSAFMDGQGVDSIPQLRGRRGSLERTPSLLGIANKDKAPQMLMRRNSTDLEEFSFSDESEEDLDFEHFVPPPVHHSPVKRREGIHRPVREAMISPQYSKSPMGSMFASQSPDQAPKAIRRRGSIESSSPTGAPKSAGSSYDTSPRKATRRQSLEMGGMPSLPTLGDHTRKPGSSLEVDATTVSTTTTHGEDEPIEQIHALEKPVGGKGRISRRASMSDAVVPMDEFTVETAVRETLKARKASGWTKGKDGSWTKGKKKMSRRASTGCSTMRPTTLRGNSFERDSENAQMMAQVCADLKIDLSTLEAKEEEHLSQSSDSRQDQSPRTSRHSKDSHKRSFLEEQGNLRPGLMRGYSFSDDDDSLIFDDEESIASHSIMSTQSSLRPSSIRGNSFDSDSSWAGNLKRAMRQESLQRQNSAAQAVPYAVFFK